MTGRLSRDDLLAADPDQLTEWERAWADYFRAHPEVVASWGHQNDRWPGGDPRREVLW